MVWVKIYIFFGKFINEKISRSTSTYFLRSLLFWILEARFCVERTVAVTMMMTMLIIVLVSLLLVTMMMTIRRLTINKVAIAGSPDPPLPTTHHCEPTFLTYWLPHIVNCNSAMCYKQTAERKSKLCRQHPNDKALLNHYELAFPNCWRAALTYGWFVCSDWFQAWPRRST